MPGLAFVDSYLAALEVDQGCPVDPTIVVMGKEPILDGSRVLGYVTSAGYGYSVGQGIVYGYLPLDSTLEGTRVQVYFFGARDNATVSKEPLFDPQNLGLRG